MSIFEFDLKTLIFFIFEIKNSDNRDVYMDTDKNFYKLVEDELWIKRWICPHVPVHLNDSVKRFKNIKEENENVEKENVLDGTRKKKRKVENGDSEKEKEKKPKKKIHRKEYVMCLSHAKSMSHLMVNWRFPLNGSVLKTKLSYKVVFC